MHARHNDQGAVAGERYAASCLAATAPPAILFLLPGEADALPWQAALDWAAARGACLPTRGELALLHANLSHAFPDAWYWSSEADAILPRLAWSHDFDKAPSTTFARPTAAVPAPCAGPTWRHRPPRPSPCSRTSFMPA